MASYLHPEIVRRPRTLAEARALIASIHPRVTSSEQVSLHASIGRCLAEDIQAPIDLPRFDVAAMDGYAIRSSDLDEQGTATLNVVSEIAAGHPSERSLGEKEAARIYTGAPIPVGADRVVPQERCRPTQGGVLVATEVRGKPHIRAVGEEVLAGQTVLTAGSRINPAQLALLTALQLETIPVLRRLRVAVLSVGDELADSRCGLRRGGIVDSNRPMLTGWLERLGCEVQDLGIIPDSSESLLQALVDVAATADLVVSSGGASVGPADYLARLIQRRGFLEFWKLNMRPGKPVGFGDIDDCPILALPGNPFAAATAFTLIGRVLIAQLSGDISTRPATLNLPLARSYRKNGNYLQVLAGRLLPSHHGTTAAVPLDVQGSASVLAIAGAEGLILLPADREDFAAGDIVEFVPI